MIKSTAGKITFSIIAISLLVMMVVLSYYYLKNIENIFLDILFIGSFVMTILFIILGSVFLYKYKKIKPNFQKLYESFELDQKRIDADVYKVKKELDLRIIAAYFYLTFMMVTIIISAIGAIYYLSELLIISIFLCLYVYFCLTGLFLSRNKQFKPDFSYQYPVINELVNDLKNEFKFNITIKILMNDNLAVQVFKYQDFYVIDVSYLLLAFLKKEEFKAILVHEFAHVINKDVDIFHETTRRVERINSATEALRMVIISFPGVISLNIKADTFALLSSLEREKRADLFVSESGYAQDLVNALYKSEMLNYAASDVLNKDITTDFLGVYHQKMVALLAKIIETNQEQYDYYLEHELPKKFKTHLIFKERCQFLHAKANNHEVIVTTDFAEDLGEADRYLYTAFPEIDDNINDNQKQIASIHRQNETYAGKTVLTLEETLTYIANLTYVNEYQKAREILENVYDEYQDNPNINYFYAVILLSYCNDKKGIEYMYKGFQNPHNIEYGYDILGNFIIKNGLKEELEILRSKQIDLANTSFDDNSDLDFSIKNAKKIAANDPFYRMAVLFLEKYSSLKKVFIFRKKRKIKKDRYYMIAGLDYQDESSAASIERELYMSLDSDKTLDSALQFYDVKNKQIAALYRRFLVKK